MAALVFPAFQDLLMRRAPFPEPGAKRTLRVNSFENPNHPWFDVSIEGGNGSFTFRVHEVHAISHLKSTG